MVGIQNTGTEECLYSVLYFFTGTGECTYVQFNVHLYTGTGEFM